MIKVSHKLIATHIPVVFTPRILIVCSDNYETLMLLFRYELTVLYKHFKTCFRAVIKSIIDIF